MECPDIEGATGNIHTNFEGKAECAVELLKKHDFVYIHVEAPDECGHRGEIENKVKAIELIDQKIIAPVIEYLKTNGEDYRVLLMPDHPTPLNIKTHSRNPVPYVIYDSRDVKDSGAVGYTEAECEKYGDYNDKGCALMDILING
jgi:2,3-bisphosphoglycerate-independent phosphoglycerate mutase